MSEFAGKFAVITGGAGGVGFAAARGFIEQGARVVIADLDEPGGERRARALGERAAFQRLDVTSEASWDALADRVRCDGARLDVLVNSAGVIEVGDIERASLASFRRVLDTNLTGTFLGCRMGIRLMKDGGGGCIVNISSGIATRALAEQPAYGASKAGIDHLTRSSALHCGRKGYAIRVVAIQPGALDSTMIRRNIPTGMTEEAFFAAVLTRFPIGRLGTYDDIARAILFVASDRASYITGAVIPVDGGQSI